MKTLNIKKFLKSKRLIFNLFFRKNFSNYENEINHIQRIIQLHGTHYIKKITQNSNR